MCSAEGALIESGKIKTSNRFMFFEHNHLRLRFTVLSLATETCSVFLVNICYALFSRILNSSGTNHFIPCWTSRSFARNLPERYFNKIIISYTKFVCPILLFLL